MARTRNIRSMARTGGRIHRYHRRHTSIEIVPSIEDCRTTAAFIRKFFRVLRADYTVSVEGRFMAANTGVPR